MTIYSTASFCLFAIFVIIVCAVFSFTNPAVCFFAAALLVMPEEKTVGIRIKAARINKKNFFINPDSFHTRTDHNNIFRVWIILTQKIMAFYIKYLKYR